MLVSSKFLGKLGGVGVKIETYKILLQSESSQSEHALTTDFYIIYTFTLQTKWEVLIKTEILPAGTSSQSSERHKYNPPIGQSISVSQSQSSL